MLYKLNTDEIESSRRIDIRTPADFDLKEQDIENFLKSRLGEIVSEDQLMLIGQERKGQEEADLLALDKDGILYIFELKRWQSDQENILQVMRYGQIFGRYSNPKCLERFGNFFYVASMFSYTWSFLGDWLWIRLRLYRRSSRAIPTPAS